MKPAPLHLATPLVDLRLDVELPELRERLARRYAAFLQPLDPAPPPPTVAVSLAGDPRVLAGDHALQGHLDDDGKTLRITTASAVPQQTWATLDRSSGVATVVPHRSLAAVDVLLRCELTVRALSLGGVALHASSILLNNGVHVFVGKSGAGKSTVAARLREEGGTVLSDEFTVVTQPSPGRFVAHGTPFWEGTPRSAPVARIWRLGRGDASSSALPRVAVLQLLAGNLSLMMAGDVWVQQSMQALGGLAQVTGGHELRYTPGQQIRALVEGVP